MRPLTGNHPVSHCMTPVDRFARDAVPMVSSTPYEVFPPLRSASLT
jgi:hypothetical protein